MELFGAIGNYLIRLVEKENVWGICWLMQE